jgi:hypothetical protein
MEPSWLAPVPYAEAVPRAFSLPRMGARRGRSRLPRVQTWLAIASSADGSKLVGADASAQAIYTSTDAGNTWSQHSPPIHPFSSVASSANGTKLIAVSGISGLADGPIFVSTNSGLNWTQMTAPISNWVTVASSADGGTLIATGGGLSSLGHLYLSADSGATWNQTNVLLINPDQFVMLLATNSISPISPVPNVVISKRMP